MHMLWVDEHNRLAKEIEKWIPGKSDEVTLLFSSVLGREIFIGNSKKLEYHILFLAKS
jgi:hypothetical protein